MSTHDNDKDNYNMMHKYSSINYLIMSLLNLNKKMVKNVCILTGKSYSSPSLIFFIDIFYLYFQIVGLAKT